MNVLEWLEFELTFYNVAVHSFSKDTTKIPPSYKRVQIILSFVA